MFKTLKNFRDLGGIPVGNGRTVKAKKILRSGEVTGLCQQDKDALINTYGIKTIVDFRSHEEVSEKPDDIFNGVKYCNIQLLGSRNESENQNGSSKIGLEIIARSGRSLKTIQGVYRALVTDPHSLQGFRNFIDEFLILQDGSLLFHCFAGKDRTGIAAAIILTLLGANEQDIFYDYLLTNENKLELDEGLVAKLQAAGLSEERALTTLKKVMSVSAEFLCSAYEAAIEKSGSFRAHIIKHLNITDEEISKLEFLYTE